MYISQEMKRELKKLLPEEKKQQKVSDVELKELELLKKKRDLLSKESGKQQEIQIWELDLEILKRNADISRRKFYLRRLSFLTLMTEVPDNQYYVQVQNKKIPVKTIYEKFLQNIKLENIEQLRFQQQMLRLKIACHKKYEGSILNLEDKNEGENLYDLQNKINYFKNTLMDYTELDFSNLFASDLLNKDASALYNSIFSKENFKKKA